MVIPFLGWDGETHQNLEYKTYEMSQAAATSFANTHASNLNMVPLYNPKVLVSMGQFWRMLNRAVTELVLWLKNKLPATQEEIGAGRD